MKVKLARERAGRLAETQRVAGRYRDATLCAAILGGQVDFRMAAGPWWAGFLLAVLGLAVAGVRSVFPQDSPDRLAWWQECRRPRRHADADGKHTTRR